MDLQSGPPKTKLLCCGATVCKKTNTHGLVHLLCSPSAHAAFLKKKKKKKKKKKRSSLSFLFLFSKGFLPPERRWNGAGGNPPQHMFYNSLQKAQVLVVLRLRQSGGGGAYFLPRPGIGQGWRVRGDVGQVGRFRRGKGVAGRGGGGSDCFAKRGTVVVEGGDVLVRRVEWSRVE